MVHAFNPSAWRQRQVDLYEFKASLVYRVGSRTTRNTQRNRVYVYVYTQAHTNLG